jgi:hypothetical protein
MEIVLHEADVTVAITKDSRLPCLRVDETVILHLGMLRNFGLSTPPPWELLSRSPTGVAPTLVA